MDIGNISPSKLKRYQLCEARAVAPKIDDDYEEEAKHEGTLAGTLAHAAAKYWYRPNPEWAKLVAAQPTAEHRLKAMQSRTLQGVEKHLIKDPAEAFQMALKEVAGDGELPREARSVLEAHILFEKIINFYKRDQICVVFAERAYKGNLSGTGVPVHLIIDIALDRGNGTLEIIDFKTGYLKIDNDEMWSDHQVLMNLLAISEDKFFHMYPVKAFRLHWVRDEYASNQVVLTPDQLSDYSYYLIWEYQRLLDLKPEEATESINRFCSSCGRRLQCKKYRQLISEAMGKFEPLSVDEMKQLDDNTLLETVERIKQQYDTLEDFIKVLKAEVGQRIKQQQVTELLGERLKARFRGRSNNSFDTGTVLALAQQYGKDPATLVDPRQKVVEAAFQGIPDAEAQLQATLRKGFSIPWVEILGKGKTKKAAED